MICFFIKQEYRKSNWSFAGSLLSLHIHFERSPNFCEQYILMLVKESSQVFETSFIRLEELQCDLVNCVKSVPRSSYLNTFNLPGHGGEWCLCKKRASRNYGTIKVSIKIPRTRWRSRLITSLSSHNEESFFYEKKKKKITLRRFSSSFPPTRWQTSFLSTDERVSCGKISIKLVRRTPTS